jgi:MFS family permease
MTGGSTGIVFAIYTIGNIAAAPFTGPIGDRFGRRWGMWIGALFIAIGACAQGFAKNSEKDLEPRALSF